MDHIPCFMLPPSPLTQHLYWTDGGYIMSSDCSYQCVAVRFNHVTSTYAIYLLLTDQTLLPLLFQCCLRNICSLVKKFLLRKIIDKFFLLSIFILYVALKIDHLCFLKWLSKVENIVNLNLTNFSSAFQQSCDKHCWQLYKLFKSLVLMKKQKWED